MFMAVSGELFIGVIVFVRHVRAVYVVVFVRLVEHHGRAATRLSGVGVSFATAQYGEKPYNDAIFLPIHAKYSC